MGQIPENPLIIVVIIIHDGYDRSKRLFHFRLLSAFRCGESFR